MKFNDRLMRICDMAIALCILVILSPLYLILIILTGIFLGRPVFFVQERTGRCGHLFKLYKFRSMRSIVRGEDNSDQARLSPFGQMLRRLSLDELPQLFNVLKGEMSLVGPRPLLKEYLPLYSQEQHRRHEVLPGITGWAQVNGRNAINWQTKFALDVWYVDNRSIYLYWKILYLTFLRVIKPRDINQSGEATMQKFTGNHQLPSTEAASSELSPITSTWPQFTEEEIAAATAVLTSGKINYWTSDTCQQFEQAFAEFIGVKHAIAVANGSLALELALHALNIGTDDEVIVPPRSFIASASSVVMCGATPIFADVDPRSQNISAATIRPHITDKTRAIIVVHLAGLACDMAPILALAAEFDIKVIEDCAQAHGALYQGKPVGSFGDIAAFSFCQNKIMTTGGEGGMVLTDDDELYQQAWSFNQHGKNLAKVTQPADKPGFRWLCDSFGTNYRMTAMQAAIGLVQLQRLPVMLLARKRNATILQAVLANYDALDYWQDNEQFGHAYYMFYCFVKPEKLPAHVTRESLLAALMAKRIPCFSGSCSEIYLERCFQQHGLGPEARLPNAKLLGETSLMFLVDPTLDETMMHEYAARVANTLDACLTKSTVSS